MSMTDHKEPWEMVRAKRVGDFMVTVTVRAVPAVVDFQDILDAVEVDADDALGAPWEEHDGWEHAAHRLRDIDRWGHWQKGAGAGADPTWVPHYNEEDVARADAHDHRLITVSWDDARAWFGGPLPGEHIQVWRERLARGRRRAIDQLVYWYENGWQWWCLSCTYLGFSAAVGGILAEGPDFDHYLNGERLEVALEVALDMEKAGWTVLHVPGEVNREEKLAARRWRWAVQLGFKTVEAYRKWLTSKPRSRR